MPGVNVTTAVDVIQDTAENEVYSTDRSNFNSVLMLHTVGTLLKIFQTFICTLRMLLYT